MLQTGTQAIADAATTAVVTFATVFTSTPTVIIPVVVNTSGDGGILTPAMTVTVKTTTGFTVLFSEAIDSENYQLMWLAGDAAGAVELMGGKKLTSYQNIDSLLNHQFKIPCLDLEGQPGMKLISEETFWSAVLQRAAQIPASPLAGLTGNLTVTADANWLYIETSDRWARIPLDASASWSTQPFYVPFREAEVALDDNTGDQVVTLTFATPFPTGELPKVMVTLLDTTSTEVAPMAFQVTDITLEGFSITLAAPLQSDNVAVYYMARQLNSFYELSADLVEEDETTSQPTHLFAQLGGLVKRLTWAGFRALMDALYLNQNTTGSAATLSATLPVAKGGTGITTLGSALQVLRTNAGATAVEWATPSGGSASAINTWAWVETSANGGSDSTGTVGDISKPFATMQAAYDAGGVCQFIGPGTFAGITKTTANIALRFMGSGATAISLVRVINPAGNSITLQDLGVHSAVVISVEIYGAGGADDNAGSNGGAVTLHNIYGVSVQSTGGAAGFTTEFGSPQIGGNGGSVTTNGNCVLANLYTYGGTGGIPYDDGFSMVSGNVGGDGGSVTVYGSLTATDITIYGASGGSGLYGGTNGYAGNGAPINADILKATTVTGFGDGTAGSGTNLTVKHSAFIGTFDGTASTPGTISGQGVRIDTLTGGTPSDLVMSNVGGTAYP